jgi:hypothetical protein
MGEGEGWANARDGRMRGMGEGEGWEKAREGEAVKREGETREGRRRGKGETRDGRRSVSPIMYIH